LDENLQRVYQSDADFVARIEASVPPGAMIMQLPFVPFPEHIDVENMHDYELLRGYLHSRKLRWSYGAMKGRPAAHWIANDKGFIPMAEKFYFQHAVYSGISSKGLDTLAFIGFSGIYVDLNGYPDDGVAIMSFLKSALDEEPIMSHDDRLAFFPLA